MATAQSARRHHVETATTLSIAIVPYAADLEEGVRQLNRRLAAGGAEIRFPESHVPDWLQKTADRTVFQEYFLAVDGGVRGGYILKTQDFWIDGQARTIADLRLPLSEGIVNPDYNFLGLQLVTNALTRQPLLFALGMGGYGQALPQLLKAMRWSIGPVPFLFRVVRPGNFLKNITALRTSKLRRFACDTAAGTGLGWLTWKAAAFLRPAYGRPRSVVWEEVGEFDPWGDEIWDAAKDDYALVAVRNTAVLRDLYPRQDKRFIRLKVSRDGKPIGWAVGLATAMAGHKQFGNMKVGTIVDGFAAPGDALDVACCVCEALEARSADVIVSNQSHAVWSGALSRCGFRQGPTNFLFAVSPKLARLLPEFPHALGTFHLNRGDGDGPIHL